MLNPTHIIVKIEEVLKPISNNRSLCEFFKMFPLSRLVELLLEKDHYSLENEDMFHIWNEIEAVLGDNIDTIVIDNIEMFISILGADLDLTIRSLVPMEVDTGEYVFDRWIDKNTIILRKHGN